MYGGQIVREARRRAGLTQRQLAERAGTTQSAIARLERGETEPGFHRVIELVRACGLELRVGLAEADDADLTLAEDQLRRSPQGRLRSIASIHRVARSARPVTR
jgi:hypothetical protein